MFQTKFCRKISRGYSSVNSNGGVRVLAQCSCGDLCHDNLKFNYQIKAQQSYSPEKMFLLLYFFVKQLMVNNSVKNRPLHNSLFFP